MLKDLRWCSYIVGLGSVSSYSGTNSQVIDAGQTIIVDNCVTLNSLPCFGFSALGIINNAPTCKFGVSYGTLIMEAYVSNSATQPNFFIVF